MRTDSYRKSPLIYAVSNGYIKIASYLLSIGADFDKGDSSENTPLHYACAYGYYEMIPLLIQAGANINVVNNWNYSPLLIGLLKDHHRCVQTMIL